MAFNTSLLSENSEEFYFYFLEPLFRFANPFFFFSTVLSPRKQNNSSHPVCRIMNQIHHQQTTGQDGGYETEIIQSNNSRLPSDVIMQILCRLPIKSVVRLRCVCKSWSHLILEPYFYDLYRQQTPTALILSADSFGINVSPKTLYTVDVDDTNAPVVRMIRSQPGKQKPTGIRISTPMRLGNSCNGFVCLMELETLIPIYIWNPITGEYVTLPRTDNRSGFLSLCGFGYSQATDEYKVVVQIHVPPGDAKLASVPRRWRAEAFTVGTKKWRKIADCNSYPSIDKSPCTNFNGALHWIVTAAPNSSELIYSFDIEAERFRFVPPPPAFAPDVGRKFYWSNISVFRGCLYICACDSEVFRPDVEIWVMKEYGKRESWVKELTIKDPMEEWWNPCRSIQLIKYLNSGEVLLLCGYRSLLVYDFRDRTYSKIKEPAGLLGQVVAHVPSFLRLTYMGEDIQV